MAKNSFSDFYTRPDIHSILEEILSHYTITDVIYIKPLGNGLINNTWLIQSPNCDYVLQRINNSVFTIPENIAHNISIIKKYLEKNSPNYFFMSHVQTITSDEYYYHKIYGYFRLYPFVQGSKTIDVATNADMAYEAAKQFGQFTKELRHFPCQTLRITFPDFHNLSFRYSNFLHSLQEGNLNRIQECANEIKYLQAQNNLVEMIEKLKTNQGVKLRVTHHDTKISNVLFNCENKGICVIDLDTTMPGYFWSDFGDMMRTYLTPVSEETNDPTQIIVREEYYKAIKEGYLGELKEELSDEEQNLFVVSGMFMVYMQALRFLTDYFNNDIYYSITYSGQNLVRAQNQIVLLKEIINKKNILMNL